VPAPAVVELQGGCTTSSYPSRTGSAGWAVLVLLALVRAGRSGRSRGRDRSSSSRNW
jgi:uncharacterized protein (TIGR03382 family)